MTISLFFLPTGGDVYTARQLAPYKAGQVAPYKAALPLFWARVRDGHL